MQFLTNPDFWSILASISTVLGSIVVIWAAIVALGQLKEMTQTRHLEAMIQVYDLIGSKEARGHRRFIYTKLKSKPEKLTTEEWGIVEDVSVTFDRIGNLVEHGLIPKGELYDGHCSVIAKLWIKLEPYIMYRRQLLGTRFVEHFEKLALDAREYYSEHFPGQTLSIVDDWPNIATTETSDDG
jgi:hypothetical protein